MPTWAKLIMVSGACAVIGATLLFGFTRNWFSSIYDSTIEGGEGAAVLGVMLLVSAAVALIIAGIIMI
jgi:hypothetical protein